MQPKSSYNEADGIRPRLHETGTKSNLDHFLSVVVLFIIDVYMRQGRKTWIEPSDFRPA